MTKLSNAKLLASIKTFTTNRDKLRDEAHVIAMMIFHHAAPKEVSDDCQGTGDVTTALQLVKAMPKSWAEQMVVWFRANTPVRIVAKNDKCEYDPKYKKLSAEEKLKWWKIEEANTVPFFSIIEEPDVQPKGADNYWRLIEGFSKRVEKDLEEGKIKPEDIDYVKAMAVVVSALRKPERPAPANTNKKTDKEEKELAAA